MSHLDQRISIACPLAQAGMRLEHFFRAHGNADGDIAKLSLRMNVDVPGLPTPMTFERSVIATIQPHRLASDMTPRYLVQWAPESPGPFPLFAGELTVEGSDDYHTFELRLTGDYTPPMGLVGKGFDVVVGNHVAQATASNLLAAIRDRIEPEFQTDEHRKAQTGLQPEPV